jgi:hypothetical protein
MIKKIVILFLVLVPFNKVFSQQWSDVGGGIDQWVNVMKVDTMNDVLYVAGDFTNAGGVSAYSIATWNGLNWSSVGSNEHFSNGGAIHALTFYNGLLIVGGSFDSIGNIRVNNIAAFNGTQWIPLGDGFDSQVYSLEVFNGELYAGGEFSNSGNNQMHRIAKWNANTWNQLADGLLGGYVHTMKVWDNKLYVGGGTFYTSTQVFYSVASWNGTNWDTLGFGFNNLVYEFGVFQNELYAAGDFTPWPNNSSTRISRWDGTTWNAMPFPSGGNQQQITGIAEYHNHLYLCGLFNLPPDFVRFNGTGYDSLCSVIGFIKELVVYKDELYAGGLFNSINGITINSIVRYNDGVNIFSNEGKNTAVIYPNPCSKSQINKIQILNSVKIQKYEIGIFDMKGKNIFTQEVHNDILNLSGLKFESGVYLINVQIQGRTYFQKLIIIP